VIFLRPKFIILITGIILFWISSNLHWGGENWRGVLESDAKGYYAYLPAAFIYQDLNFHFFDQIEKEKYYREHLFYDYRNDINGKLINKYYAGTAMLQAPFFFIAHGVSQLTDEASDGYSKWYMILISLSAIFYHLIGLIFIYKTLRLYEVKDYLISIVLIATSFASNLFVYTIVEPGMSHVYSFALIAAFFYCVKLFLINPAFKRFIWMSILLGLIVLVRPINVLVVLAIPFLTEDRKQLLAFIKKVFGDFKLSSVAFLIFSALISIQLFIYKISTGKYWVYSYTSESFDFSNPHFLEILFSYKKGLFLYTPIYLLAFAGLIPLWKRNKFRFGTWIFFFILITYILSSWWMWYYGGSFSSRVYVEYLPFFMLLLGIGINSFKKPLRHLMIACIFLIGVVCQIQSYQYRYYEIHYSEMNKEKYWDVFLMRNRF